ncbi:MAG: hypothetical protein P9L92_12330 [Candidatus Electryonea clarkiae]|nr:hypothetical protein [Candidatus Electryonea clarkiae]MDP8286519.1 hypothetical protein [Candidatus Electryonea clarkiae]
MENHEKINRYIEAYRNVEFTPSADDGFVEQIKIISHFRRKRQAQISMISSVVGAFLLTFAVWKGADFLDRYSGTTAQPDLLAESYDMTLIEEQIEEDGIELDDIAVTLLDDNTSELYFAMQEDYVDDPEDILMGFEDDLLEETLDRIRNVELL